MSRTRLALPALALCLLASGAAAQTQTLKVTDRAATQTYTLRELMTKHVLQDITVPDRLYGKSMSYRAIPMVELLRNLRLNADDYIKATATDNFAVDIPVRLLRPAAPGDVEAFLALEDPAKPWPAPPKELDKDKLGPFYIVWRSKGAGHVSREYWSAELASLGTHDSPLKKWPGLDVAATVPPADRIRTGLDRFVALCITCHKVDGIGGAGAAAGPDLNQPRSVLDAMDAAAFRKYVRGPKAVKEDAKMPKFDDVALSDDDLDAMIAWLAYRKTQPR